MISALLFAETVRYSELFHVAGYVKNSAVFGW